MGSFSWNSIKDRLHRVCELRLCGLGLSRGRRDPYPLLNSQRVSGTPQIIEALNKNYSTHFLVQKRIKKKKVNLRGKLWKKKINTLKILFNLKHIHMWILSFFFLMKRQGLFLSACKSLEFSVLWKHSIQSIINELQFSWLKLKGEL